jgi:hypothetical protein
MARMAADAFLSVATQRRWLDNGETPLADLLVSSEPLDADEEAKGRVAQALDGVRQKHMEPAQPRATRRFTIEQRARGGAGEEMGRWRGGDQTLPKLKTMTMTMTRMMMMVIRMKHCFLRADSWCFSPACRERESAQRRGGQRERESARARERELTLISSTAFSV